MNEQQNIMRRAIKSHGEYSAEAQRMQSRGQNASDLIYRAQQLEKYVKANLNPNAWQAALTQSQEHSFNHHAAQDKLARQWENNAASKALEFETSAATKGLLGLDKGVSPQQFRDARDGKAVRIDNAKPQSYLKNADPEVKQRKKHLEQAQYIKGQYPYRTNEEYTSYLNKHGLTDQQVKAYDDGGFTLAWNEHQAKVQKNDPDSYEINPSDQDQRKSQVIDSWAKHEKNIPSNDHVDENYKIDTYNDTESPEYDNIAVDIAAAFDHHDAQLENEAKYG